MTRKAEREFRWVHAIGGRKCAAQYLCSLGFGSKDEILMMKRLSHWTNEGEMGGQAVRAMAAYRVLYPGDFVVMTAKEYAEQMSQDYAA